MLTRKNFKSVVLSLSDEEKAEILKEEFGYVYFTLSSYGDVWTRCTDDNDGKLHEEISSPDWDGLTYLVPINEVSDILAEVVF